tara:strand:- start:524 stop:982 length:459 start_codon:yes stop_codon:yes gene_type:complete
MGPVADIILNDVIDNKFEIELRSFISSIGGAFYDRDIVYKKSSFLLTFGWSYPDEILEYSHLEKAAALKPTAKLNISANSNDESDHRHLGELCYAIVSKYSAVLEFCDNLNDRTSEPYLLQHPEHYSNGYTSQFGPDLLSLWLEYKYFHMVK